MSKQYLQIHPKDNVLAALTDLSKGTSIHHNGGEFKLSTDTRAKHKFTVEQLEGGEEIIMYGTLVGKTTKPIAQGETITMENVVHASLEYSVGKQRSEWRAPDISKWKDRTFNGYHRADGSAGTANYWLIIPMVFCENRNVEVMKSALQKSLGYHMTTDFVVDTETLVRNYKNGATSEELLGVDIIRTPEDFKQSRTFPNVDGIKFLTHEGGCGGFRLDSETLCNLFAGYITNSNVAGATILSLGCQNAEVKNLEKGIQERDPNFSKPLYILEQHKSKSERHFIEEAVKKTFLGLIEANKIERRPAPLSHLVLGLECGGSDGFSGISANPALGHVSDLLVALGATTILS
ncbi:MAG: UxaA family hydrolase, partial [Aurantibacter sp.]